MTESRGSHRLILGLFVGATLLAGFAFGAWQMRAKSPSVPSMTVLDTATMLPSPVALPEFRLHDDGGKAFGPERLRGNWSLLFFGFANCGHVCPMTLTKLTDVVAQLDSAPRIVFLSVDPGRDTPEVLRRYVDGFGGDMVGVSGDDAEIRALAAALGVMYSVQPDPEHYVVEHSQAVFVLDPEGRYTAVISSVDDPAGIARDLGEIFLEAGA